MDNLHINLSPYQPFFSGLSYGIAHALVAVRGAVDFMWKFFTAFFLGILSYGIACASSCMCKGLFFLSINIGWYLSIFTFLSTFICFDRSIFTALLLWILSYGTACAIFWLCRGLLTFPDRQFDSFHLNSTFD